MIVGRPKVPTLRTYTVTTRFRSILEYTVEATSKADAIRRFKRGDYMAQNEVGDEGDTVIRVDEGDLFRGKRP